jgi:polyphenol oxidase
MLLHRGRIGARTQFCFTDRLGGVSAAPYDSLNLGDHVDDHPQSVVRNRALIASEISTNALVFMSQVHGTHVERIDALGHLPNEACDAMVTDTLAALAVLVADCVPVLLADDVAGVVGVAHVGRRGLRDGVLAATFREMHAAGATDIAARVGPCICAGCYEVGSAVRDEVSAAVPRAAATTRAGTPAIDLRAGVASVLAAWEVDDVEHVEACTAEDPRLYSYRRDGVTGRLAGAVWRA